MNMDLGKIWSVLPTPAILLSPENNISDANPAAEEFMNRSARFLGGMAGAELFDPAINLHTILAQVRNTGSRYSVNNTEIKMGQTTLSPCNVQIAPFASDGTVLMLLEPKYRAERFGRADAAKSAARSAIGMAEMLAHEIKNPLAGITGAAQLIAMKSDGDDSELSDLIVAECNRIVELLDQVEQFGNLHPPERSAHNVHAILDKAKKSAKVGFAANMNFVEHYDPSVPDTFADPSQMMQVFSNLIKNAAEAAGPDGGTITLRTYFDAGTSVLSAGYDAVALPLQIEICDDGPGLPLDLAANVFEPFVSGKQNGSGLGLALVSKLLTENGGLVDVQSDPGNTIFRISLPLAQE